MPFTQKDEVLAAAKKDKRIKLFKDPGKGKSFALNLIFKQVQTDILLLTCVLEPGTKPRTCRYSYKIPC